MKRGRSQRRGASNSTWEELKYCDDGDLNIAKDYDLLAKLNPEGEDEGEENAETHPHFHPWSWLNKSDRDGGML